MSRKIGVILSYILMVFEVLSTLLLTPFIIRTLGQAEYGVYKLTTAINGYLLLLDLGIGNATIRFLSKYRANNDKKSEGKFMGIITIYYIIIAILTIIIGIIITMLFPVIFSKGLTFTEIAIGQKLIFITMITSAITLGTAGFNNTLIAYEKFGVSKLTQIVAIIFRLIISYLALRMGFGSIALVLINLLITLITRTIFIFYSIKNIKIAISFKNIRKKEIKEIVGYSSLIILQMIATQLNASIDQILIGSLVVSSSSILAVYSVGSQINQYYQSIGSSFNGVLMPGVVKLVEKKASPVQLTNEMIRIGRIIFMVLAIILGIFAVEGKDFIILWAGSVNVNAYYVSLLLMSTYALYLTESIGTQILWATNEQKELSFLKLLIVLLNIGLTVLLIKWNPLFGATVGTCISIILGDIILSNVIYYIKLKIDIVKYYKELFKGILPSIILIVICGMLINRYGECTWFYFLMKSLVLFILYGILMILIGFNDYEKKIINSFFIKLKKMIKKEGK